jgi:amino acid permease
MSGFIVISQKNYLIQRNLLICLLRVTMICFLVVTFFSHSVLSQELKAEKIEFLAANIEYIEQKLQRGQTFQYQITLEANQFLEFAIVRNEIDIIVQVFDSSYKQIHSLNTRNGNVRDENLTLFSENNVERFIFKVSALDNNSNSRFRFSL